MAHVITTTHHDVFSTPASKARWKWLLSFLLFAVAFIVVLRNAAWFERDILLFKKVKPLWLLMAIAAQCSTYLAAAAIYRVLLQTGGLSHRPGLLPLSRAAVISLLLNQTVPSASISGNVFLFRFLRRFNVKADQGLLVILSELLLYYLAVVVLLIYLLVAGVLTRQPHIIVSTLIAGILVHLALGLFLLLVSRRKMLPRLYRLVSESRLVKKKIERFGRITDQSTKAIADVPVISNIVAHKPAAALCLLLQLLVLIADGFTLYALFHGSNIHISLFTAVLCLACTQIVSLIPFLPGSLVLFESGMSWFFSLSGVSLGSAIVVTLLYRFLSFWLPMPVGAIFYRSWRKSISPKQSH